MKNKKLPNENWVKYHGLVVDVSDFIVSHPGGPEVLKKYIGKDITTAFKEHNHSEIAKKMIENMTIGKKTQYKEKVNPYRGTLYQVWTQLDLESYLEFINNPKSIVGHIRIFDSPFLEPFSKTPWQLIPLFFMPICIYYFVIALLEIGLNALPLFVFGFFFWTFFEYSLHRLGFHSEDYLINNRFVIALHYFAHGIHHAYPMDSYRLVFPPTLGLIIAWVFKQFVFNLILPFGICEAIYSGKVLGYIYYDLFHYYSHHANGKINYYKFMKSYHLAHHYKNPKLGFGVSSHFWDVVFNTQLQITNKPTRID